MKWFRENRWLGTFLIVFAICTLIALYLLFSERSAFEEASARFNDAAAERNRLEHLNPFPNETNFRQLKKHIENYAASLTKLKGELKTQVIPVVPMAPNEFQSHLRQAMTATTDKARANRVKLPDNFQLGFDQFTTALPNTAVAPLLGQELGQIEVLMGILIDARVDALTAFKRMPLAEENAAAATPTPTPGPGRRPAAATMTGLKMIERSVLDLTFTASPSAARKVLNQIASSNQQFYIVRLLHVHNDQEKGPPREQPGVGGNAGKTAETAPAHTGAAAAPNPTPSAAIKFIVGNEQIDVSARIEMVRFDF